MVQGVTINWRKRQFEEDKNSGWLKREWATALLLTFVGLPPSCHASANMADQRNDVNNLRLPERV